MATPHVPVYQSCPDCGRFHAVPSVAGRRWLVRCTNCRRLWSPYRADDVRASDLPGGKPPVAPLLEVRPFWEELSAVLLYALRGQGAFLLAFFWFGGYVPILSWLIPPLLVAYGAHVVRRSASSPQTAPGFPEPDNVVLGFVYPFLRTVVAGVVAGLPLILYWQYAPDELDTAVVSLLALIGLLLFPAIVLIAVVEDRMLAAVSPARVASTIRWLGGDYIALLAAFAAFGMIWRATGWVADQVEIMALATRFVRLYLVVTAFHLMGRTVWQTRYRIEWGI